MSGTSIKMYFIIDYLHKVCGFEKTNKKKIRNTVNIALSFSVRLFQSYCLFVFSIKNFFCMFKCCKYIIFQECKGNKMEDNKELQVHISKQTNGQFVLPKILLQAKKNFYFSVIENSYNKKFGPNCFLAFLTVTINQHLN